MKISFKLSFLFILLTLNNAFAQKVEVKLNHDERPVEDLTYAITNLSLSLQNTEDDEFIYMRVNRKKNDEKLIIAKIKKSTGVTIWEKETTYPLFSKEDGRFCHLEKKKDGFYIFYKSGSALQAQELDDAFKPIGQKKTISKGSVSGSFSNYLVSKSGTNLLFYDYDFSASNDSYILRRGGRKNMPFTAVVIDNSLNVLWENNIVGAKDKYYELEKAYLDKNKNASFVFKVSTNNKEVDLPNATIEYSVTHYNFTTKELISKPIDFGNQFKFFSDVTITFDSINNIVGFTGGFHRTKKSSTGGNVTDAYHGGEGFFNIEYGLDDLQRTKQQVVLFSDEIKSALIGEKQTKKGKLPAYFTLHNKTTNANKTNTYVFYGYKDGVTRNCLIVNVNTDGQVIWFKVIIRGCNNAKYEYNTIFSFNYSGVTYVMFNASEESVLHPEKTNGYSAWGKGEMLALILGYDQEGNLLVTKQFKHNKGSSVDCNIEKTSILDEGKFVLVFDKKSDYGIVKSVISGFLEVKQ